MPKAVISGMGKYIPKRAVTNNELSKSIETSDEWIQERTGIKKRHFAEPYAETTTTMGARAAEQALERAGIEANEVDFIIFATLSPDYYFPGCGVLVQRELGITSTEIGALDVRNQCTGFIYALSVADQYIRSGMYKNILVIGSEMHSIGLDFTTRGRGVAVIFGDGAGAAVVQAAPDDSERGILTTKLHSDGTYAEKLAMISPGSHGGYHADKTDADTDFGFKKNAYGAFFVTQKMVDDALLHPVMEGQFVFKLAVRKFPEVIMEALTEQGFSPADIDLLVPHQANLRISQFVQRTMKLRDDQVYNNIQEYGNTTAASIPIALCEAIETGAVKEGDLVCLAAFGSGFTWGSALMRL